MFDNMPYYNAPEITYYDISVKLLTVLPITGNIKKLLPNIDYTINNANVVYIDPNTIKNEVVKLTIDSNVVSEGDTIYIINKNNSGDKIQAKVFTVKSTNQINVTKNTINPFERETPSNEEINVRNNFDNTVNDVITLGQRGTQNINAQITGSFTSPQVSDLNEGFVAYQEGENAFSVIDKL